MRNKKKKFEKLQYLVKVGLCSVIATNSFRAYAGTGSGSVRMCSYLKR